MECPGCIVAGACVAPGALGPTPCLICDPLRAADDWSANDGVSCDDGQFCSVDDQCRAGTCTGQPRRCDDGIACNGVSTCDEAAGSCTPPTNLCGSLELCASDGRCVATCDGCVIASNCVAAGAQPPGNPCVVCDPARSTADYVPRQDCGDEPCDPICECADDSDPTTTLVQHPSFGCGFSRSIAGESWVSFSNGVEVDPAHGFAWIRQGFLSVADTNRACAGLNISGVTGWRLPTIDEARSLAQGCSTSDACPLSDPTCLTQSCIASCTACRGAEGPRAGLYCRPVVPFCTEVHTSSNCSDCANPSLEWTYGPVNANFLASDPTRAINAYCFHTGIEL